MGKNVLPLYVNTKSMFNEFSPDSIAIDYPITDRKSKKISKSLRISQFLTWPILKIIFGLTIRLKITGRENLQKIESPVIIAANHINFYDSFLFRIILGLRTKHLPLRFMAVKHFSWPVLNFLYSIGIIPLIYKLFGVFTITPGKGLSKNLEEAYNIIKDGNDVVIYPEGKIVTVDQIGPFKVGAVVLARNTGVPILPISLKSKRKGFLRNTVYANIGEPLYIESNSAIDQATDKLRASIISLHSIE